MKNIIFWFLIIDTIIFCSLYFSLINKLRQNHIKKYNELGKPTVFNFIWGRQFSLVLLFLLVNEYKELNDPLIMTLCKVLKILTIVNIIITIAILIYFMFLLKREKAISI